MNILVYSRFYPAPEGLRTKPDTLVVHYFVKELQRAGHTVQVVFLQPTLPHEVFHNRFRDIVPTEADYSYEGVPVHLFRYQSLTPHRYFPERFQASFLDRRIRALKNRLGWRPDRVFVHFPTSFTGLTEIFAEDVPVLGDFHNMDLLALNGRCGAEARAFIRRLKTWAYRNKRVLAGLEAVEKRPMTRSYSGLDPSLLDTEEQLREKLKERQERMRILYAGQLTPLKNVDVLIRAVRELVFPWELTIVGDGPEREKLEALAASCPGVRFTGKLPRAEVSQRMREADVFIMLSSPETYGLVYLEAMARGCLTIASRGEGFDGIIRDGENGFLEEPGSVEAAVRCLTRAWALPGAERKRLVEAGYALACSMTEEQTARRLLQANE